MSNLMSLSNLHSFHFAQILQNAMALPEHVYQNINNRSSINRILHLHQNNKLRRRKTRPRQKTKSTTVYQPLTSQNNNRFTPSPFPEHRDPVTVSSKAVLKKPAAPLKQANLKKQAYRKKLAYLEKQARLKKQMEQLPIEQQSPTPKIVEDIPGSRPAGNVVNSTWPPKKLSIEERWLKSKLKTNPYGKPKPGPRQNQSFNSHNSSHRSEKSNQRTTWKPGRGAVEKIDRRTGEIVHLAEESFAHKKNI